MEDSLKKVDEITKRVNVPHKRAMEALEEAGGDVLKAVMNLEEKYPDALLSLKKAVTGTVENMECGNYIKVSGKNCEIMRLPVIAGAAFAVLCAYRPRVLLAAAGAVALTGSDVSITLGGHEYSLRKSIRANSRKASEGIFRTRYELENRLGDLKDKNFLKEDGTGERYFVIKL